MNDLRERCGHITGIIANAEPVASVAIVTTAAVLVVEWLGDGWLSFLADSDVEIFGISALVLIQAVIVIAGVVIARHLVRAADAAGLPIVNLADEAEAKKQPAAKKTSA